MKKLITKFLSVFFAVFIAVSAVPAFSVSAEYSGLTEFGEVSLSAKNNFFSNNELIYKYVFAGIGNDEYYYILFFGTDDDDLSNIRLSAKGSMLYFNAYVHAAYLCFYSDGNFRNYKNYGSVLSAGFGYYEMLGGFNNYSNAVFYSDFSVYDVDSGNVVYDKSNNLPFYIENFDRWGFGSSDENPDLNDIYGPFPLIPVDIGSPTMQGFIQWLIENQKYRELSQYGLSVASGQVSNLVSIWAGNQNSITKYFESLKAVFSSISAITQAKNIYNWFSAQYDAYKRSLITWIEDRPPQSVTDTSTDYDNDGNFISSETAYLKLILNNLIAFMNNEKSLGNFISETISATNNNIYRIAVDVSNIPTYTANAIYNNFVEPINEIIDSVKNISVEGGDSITNNNVNVNIDIDNIDQTENNFNIAFGDLQLTLENKFSFYNQLTQITYTVQNYNYSSEAPEITLNFGSEFGLPDSEQTIDFSFYEPYRQMIRSIIIAVAYISFAINLLHRLPDIIGGI